MLHFETLWLHRVREVYFQWKTQCNLKPCFPLSQCKMLSEWDPLKTWSYKRHRQLNLLQCNIRSNCNFSMIYDNIPGFTSCFSCFIGNYGQRNSNLVDIPNLPRIELYFHAHISVCFAKQKGKKKYVVADNIVKTRNKLFTKQANQKSEHFELFNSCSFLLTHYPSKHQ